MHPRTAVALVIPAWDELDAIGAVLDEVPRALVDDVFVVVGSDSDPTADVARAHAAQVLVPQRRGYGAACWTGVQAALAAGASVIAFLDGDYADPPGELARLLAPIHSQEADLVLGCRDLRRFPDALPLHARVGNALVCILLKALLGTRLRDLPSFKVIRAESLRQLNMQEMTYGWTVEMLVKAARRKLRIAQLDVPYRPRRGGKSKVAGDARASFAAAWKLLGCALSYAAASGQ